jgi:hypothetical protein
MTAYEKLGVFYLGKAIDPASGKPTEDHILYDSKDLTTHAVIIGMTGSGKTGLGLGLIEEALIDNIPVIAIDPKGDIANLLLLFPQLASADFLPWIDEREATAAGMNRQEFAQNQADLWRRGLAEWGQGPERIGRLKAAAEFAVYTPGSRAGRPLNALGDFAPPPPGVADDRDLLRERIQAAAASLLALAGVEADPMASREHILVANIFSDAWSAGKTVDLPGLVRAVQEPPFSRVGVMDLDSFYPAKDRFQLAMRFNNLLAAPGFEAWMEGDPIDIGRLLYTAEGRPRASVISLSHLSDAERMFCVTRLLNEVLAWVRTQPGTSSLRAVLYMDEIFGYFPPVANPPSKPPLLTLLKQARAFGLGVVLATQNPVDLDYKGLSNTGTWFIGRLQTEGDKDRVMAGLEGAAAGGRFDRGRMERTLAGLGKRVFLLNNVHENEPAVFQTRWTLSYLRGPLTREHIKSLTAQARGLAAEPKAAGTPPAAAALKPSAAAAASQAHQPPVLGPGLSAYYLKASAPEPGVEYFPAVLARLEVRLSSVKHQVETVRRVAYAAVVADGPVPLDWDQAVPIAPDPGLITARPAEGAVFNDLPAAANKPKSYDAWRRELTRWARQNCAVRLYRSPRLALTSRPEESKADFLARLALAAREKRDLEAEKLRRRYAEKYAALKERLMRAEQVILREREQLTAKKVETAISFGTAILGAFLGRKAVSATTAGRLGTAAKSAGRLRKESMDTARAADSAEAVRAQMAELDRQLQADIDAVAGEFDPAGEELQEIPVLPSATGIAEEFFGLTWLPYRRDESNRLVPGW